MEPLPLHEPSWTILFEVLILLGFALVLGTLAEQLRQSTFLGYMLAGTLVGPSVFGLVESGEHVSTIAELGVALLLFTIGLEFSFQRLRRLGRIAFIGGSLQVVLTLSAAAVAAWLLGLSTRGSLAVGAVIALSSTACVLHLLMDRAVLDSIYGRNSMGILLMQDAAVVPLMLGMAMLTSEGTWGDAGVMLLRTVLMGGLLIGAFYLVFCHAVPRFLNIRQWARNRDLPILLAFVMVLGSVIAAHSVSISPAMGAFIAGVLLGASPFAVQIRADVSSLRTLFVTLFFASIGLLGDPMWVFSHAPLVLGMVSAILIGKALIVWLVIRFMGFSNGLAAATGLCLAQVGEFSFLLAKQAHGRVFGDTVFQLLISAMIITLFLTPFLIAFAPRLAGWLDASPGRPREPEPIPDTADGQTDTDDQPAILIIGYGPAGHRTAMALRRMHAKQTTVIDLNTQLVKTAKGHGFSAMVGDATRREVLEHIHIQRMALIIITLPDPDAARTIIHHCKYLAPHTPMIARSRYHVFRWELQLAGALEVIDEEEQVGLRIAATAKRLLRNHPGRPTG